MPHAQVTTVASFPQGSFLENLAARHDGSILVTILNRKELWWLPAAEAKLPVEPVLVHTFDRQTMGLVETEPDVFYVCTSEGYTTHESTLERIDLNGWTPGEGIISTTVTTFGDPVGALNGACLIAPDVILVADSIAGLIWRVDLNADGSAEAPRIWLKHASMAFDPANPLKPPQPAVNGVRFAERAGHVYYTCTQQKLFMRVAVDPDTHEPASEPELVTSGTMDDDFCVDEDAGVAYVTTHRENTIDRVALDPSRSEPRVSVLGDPFDARVIGPSSLAWGRGPGEAGRVVYATTDGGTTAPPPDGAVRPAAVLRIELAARATSTPEVRRVVVGHDARGKSVVTSDQVHRAEQVRPGIGIRGTELWVTDSTPVDNAVDAADEQQAGSLKRFHGLYVGNGQGSAFRVTFFPPGVTRISHRTQTVDYDLILQGEIDLVLDDDETVHLRAGDTVIVRGSLHAWSNPGPDPAAVAFVMIDADPVEVAGHTLGKHYPTLPNG